MEVHSLDFVVSLETLLHHARLIEGREKEVSVVAHRSFEDIQKQVEILGFLLLSSSPNSDSLVMWNHCLQPLRRRSESIQDGSD